LSTKETGETKIAASVKETVQEAAAQSGVLRRMALLQEIALKIDAASGRDEILSILRSEVRALLPHQVCLLCSVNTPRTHYVVSSLSPVADTTELSYKHFAIDEGMPGWVIKNQAAIIAGIESGPVFTYSIEGRLQDVGVESLLIVPLRTANEVTGALVFGSVGAEAYNVEDQSVAQQFAVVLASALRNTSIVEDARKRIAQIELINSVANTMTSVLNLEELLKAAAATIRKTFNYFDVTVFLFSEDRTELIVEAHAGNFVDFLPHGYRQKLGQGVIGWVAEHGEKALCNDVSLDPRYMVYEYHNTKSELAIPIRIEEVVVGVLNVEDTKLHAFDEMDSIVLETLSDQLGVAIKNAKLYEEVRRANMKLTELDKMKSEFLGIVSHDFRSPLSSIMLASRALLKTEAVQDMPRMKEYLQLILNQANRLNQLAEDTLSITKLESGRLSYHFKIVNVERLIQDAVTLVRFSSRHQFDYTIDPKITFIKGDQSKLRQVLQNLVGNAVKYSPRGGKVTITVDDYSPEQILISVTDQGMGIPAEQVDKLFQKFSRVDSGETREIKGAGLGLWICREVVEAHGGKIWIESELGKGTTFKLTLNKAQE
jgi:K+-sensing histidine kinase KdpD